MKEVCGRIFAVEVLIPPVHSFQFERSVPLESTQWAILFPVPSSSQNVSGTVCLRNKGAGQKPFALP